MPFNTLLSPDVRKYSPRQIHKLLATIGLVLPRISDRIELAHALSDIASEHWGNGRAMARISLALIDTARRRMSELLADFDLTTATCSVLMRAGECASVWIRLAAANQPKESLQIVREHLLTIVKALPDNIAESYRLIASMMKDYEDARYLPADWVALLNNANTPVLAETQVVPMFCRGVTKYCAELFRADSV